MDLQLTGKRALVSGSTAGIGLAVATLLAKEGADVIVNGRTDARVSEAVAKVKADAKAHAVTGVAADLGAEEGARKLFAAVPDVDILVNNLGIFEAKPFFDVPDADWRRFFDVNVLSGVRLARHYMPGMLERNWGRVVFVSSESGVNIPVEMIHYGMTKTAQLAVSRGLAELTVGTAVTVNTVLPGPTMSEGVNEFVTGLAKQQNTDARAVEQGFFKTMRPSSLLKRFERPEEVANLVAYVCSPLASGTNGAALRVEGGLLRSIV
jgi:NAD(P)-dependent dehydrogenase (short-subunit alcohol dehydrogenase family)